MPPQDWRAAGVPPACEERARGVHRAASALALALLAAGCSSGGAPLSLPTQPSLGLPTATLPSLGDTPSVDGTPTAVYEDIARRALNCWFGARGPLKTGHIFYAEAAPPTNGGEAEIVIHERDPGQANPRGARAYRISFAPEGPGRTRMTLQNVRIPADLAEAMRLDALAWVAARESCQAQVVRPPPPEPLPAIKPPKARQRVKTART